MSPLLGPAIIMVALYGHEETIEMRLTKISANQLVHILREKAPDVHHAMFPEDIMAEIRRFKPEAIPEGYPDQYLAQRLRRMSTRGGSVAKTEGRPQAFYYRRTNGVGKRLDVGPEKIVPLQEVMERFEKAEKEMQELIPSMRHYLEQFRALGKMFQGRED